MRQKVARTVVAVVSGLVFGLGLTISGMVDPARVRAFLDIFGAWNPSLAFVLGGAVVVAFAGVLVMKRLERPAFDHAFHLPGTQRIDRRLVIGSAIFGVGWGMAGLCPGPAVADLALFRPDILIFVAAMVAGMLVHDRLWIRTRSRRP